MRKCINSLIITTIISGLILVLSVSVYSTPKTSRIIYITAKSAMVVNERTNKILYAKNQDLRVCPASTAKMMTALIILEKLSLDKIITVSKRSANIEPSRAGLRQGIQYRAGDLLAACLMSSSNDAALALAEGLCGLEDEFVKLMNKKAKKIGMKNTHFANSTGLPSERKEQYSTAYDLGRLIRYALGKPLIAKLLNTKEKFIKGSDGREIRLANHNKMLWKRPNSIIGKTGYTKKSRHCFVGATTFDRNKRIIFAILSAEKPWQDISIMVNHGLYRYNSRLYSRQKQL